MRTAQKTEFGKKEKKQTRPTNEAGKNTALCGRASVPRYSASTHSPPLACLVPRDRGAKALGGLGSPLLAISVSRIRLLFFFFFHSGRMRVA